MLPKLLSPDGLCVLIDKLFHRLLNKWTMPGKSPSITTDPNTVQNKSEKL